MEQKSRLGQKIRSWLCAVVIGLGILVPKTEVLAANINQVEFSISQILDIERTISPQNEQELKEQEFVYVLEAIESENPLPQGRQDNQYIFSLKGNQSLNLEPLTFTEVGEYHYQLRLQEIKADKAFTYDPEVYEMTVYVTESNGRVRADAIALNKAGLKNEELIFTHSYAPTGAIVADDITPTSKPAVNNPTDGVMANVNTSQPSIIGNQASQTTTGAKTGDDTAVFLFISIGVIALLTMMGILATRKKNIGN